MGLIIPDKIVINKGSDDSSFSLDVSGFARISSLAGTGKMIVAGSDGSLGIQNLSGGSSSSAGYVGLFGDGSLGDASISGTLTLTSERSYKNLQVLNGGVINTAGHILRVKGTLTINSGGYIRCNGEDGGGISGGSAPYTSVANPEFGVPSSAGYGEYGGDIGTYVGYPGSGGLGVLTNTGAPYLFRSGSGGGGGGGLSDGYSQTATSGANVWMLAGQGGSGGYGYYGGINPDQIIGAGGGGGGGVCCIYAYKINNAGVIQANGGKGGDAMTGPYNNFGGAGGGGGGGTVIVYYRFTIGSGVGTLQANGGAAGSNNGGYGSPAVAGTSGLTMSCQI